MKIIQSIGWIAPRYGGPAILVPQLAEALALRGHEVIVITTNADGAGVLAADQVPLEEESGYKTLACEVNRPRWYLVSRAMSGALNTHLQGADVLHIHCLYRFHTLEGRRVSHRLHVPYVLTPHGALTTYQRKRHRLRKAVYHRVAEDRNIKNASLIVYNSDVEQEEARASGFDVPSLVIPNPVDVRGLQIPTDESWLPKQVRDGDGPFILFVGRLAEKKGIPRLISALAIVRKSVPAARLVIAGPDDDGLESTFKALAGRLGIAEGVSFVGPISGRAKVALYQHARVFGLPSDDENFGMVVAEAMAAGTPVVISEHVALHGLVSERGAGTVVGTEPAEIARALLPYLQDPDLARGRGLHAAAAATEQFSWDTVAARYETVYAGVAVRSRVR